MRAICEQSWLYNLTPPLSQGQSGFDNGLAALQYFLRILEKKFPLLTNAGKDLGIQMKEESKEGHTKNQCDMS